MDRSTAIGSVVTVTSTVLDAALALLLISAAVVTVTTADQSAISSDRDDTAQAGDVLETLATATTAVNYTLAPGAANPGNTSVQFRRTNGPEFQRTAHGTYARLLARSALATLEIDGERVTHAGDDFQLAVENAVRTEFVDGHGVQVVAIWRPYPDAHIGGQLQVGGTPPPDATVDAAVLTVPSGYPAAHDDALAAADRDGFAGVARVVASRVVAGALPPKQMRFALSGDYPVSALAANRYARFALLTSGDETEHTAGERADSERVVGHHIAAGDVHSANDVIAAALTERIERDLRSQYDDPRAAARAVHLDRVRIVVRTWS